MKLNDDQLAELEKIRGWACCLEPERRFMAEIKFAALKREIAEHAEYDWEGNPINWCAALLTGDEDELESLKRARDGFLWLNNNIHNYGTDAFLNYLKAAIQDALLTTEEQG